MYIYRAMLEEEWFSTLIIPELTEGNNEGILPDGLLLLLLLPLLRTAVGDTDPPPLEADGPQPSTDIHTSNSKSTTSPNPDMHGRTPARLLTKLSLLTCSIDAETTALPPSDPMDPITDAAAIGTGTDGLIALTSQLFTHTKYCWVQGRV